MASRKGTWLNQINEPFRVDSAMSLLASFLLKADKRQDRKSTCLPDQDQDVGDGVASCFAWPFSCLAAKKDNGIKSSKMKRKRQIMLRDLNWISRRVCGSLCVCVSVCVWTSKLAMAVKPLRFTHCQCRNRTETGRNATRRTRRALDSRVLTSILSLDFLSHFFLCCRFVLFFAGCSVFYFPFRFVMFCMLDTIRRRRVLTALCILKCSMAFILSAL